VGREHDEGLEGNLELLPRLQREEIDAAFERHDPAAEKHHRRNLLSAKVVDDEHAAVCEDLQRRAIESRRGAESEFEPVEHELTAGGNEGPPTSNPSAIVQVHSCEARAVFTAINPLVVDRIEDSNDVTINRQGVWYGHVSSEDFANRLGNDRLTVARRPVDEQRVARGNRR